MSRGATLRARNIVAALNQTTLSDVEFRVVQDLVDYFDDHRGRLVEPSPLFDRRVLERIIYHAHREMIRDLARALPLARLATEVAARVPARQPAESSELSFLEGKAWHELAAALLRHHRYAEAHEAVLMAKTFFSLPLTVRRVNDAEALLDLVYGQVLHFLGRTDEGLQVIDRASDVLLFICGDPKKFVAARTTYATVLMRLDRFDEAFDVFDQAADMAAEMQDRETLAHVLVNLAFCAAKTGDDAFAEKCQAEAVALFVELGMKSELPRARGSLIESLKRQGRIAEAISELYKVTNDYLELKLPLTAALISLDTAELLIASKRFSQAEHLCGSLAKMFARAGLAQEARKALRFVAQSSGDIERLSHAVADARTFLKALAADESLTFSSRAS